MWLTEAPKPPCESPSKTCQAVYFAPHPKRTTGIVRSRIFTSIHSDQLSMYSRWSRTQSAKLLIRFRPCTCQRQVESRLHAQAPPLRRGLKFLHLERGEGPRTDQAHVALQHVVELREFTRLVLRMNFPIEVTRGSFSILNTGPLIWLNAISSAWRMAASVCVERNLYIVNGRPFPTTLLAEDHRPR